jgi:nucleoside-diphosphate-sugar epimerase
MENHMRILVTGGAGYLGAVLVPKLIARGHSVRVLDLGYFGLDHLRAYRSRVELVRDDIRRVQSDSQFSRELLDGCDAVIHLAAISNDPSADLNPELTEDVNFRSTVALAEAARARRVKLIFSSSCSVYGEADGEIAEHGVLAPLTTYATSKVQAERALAELADASWSPIILRNGTLFGYSPRMRFDLVANIFALYSALHNEIKIFGDGLQWRPFLHVRDCARAFLFFAEHPSPHHGCYNIAYQNLRVVDLADTFTRLYPQLRVSHLEMADEDRRNYRVSTQRMHDEGFRTQVGLELGVEEMVEAILGHQIPDPESIYYRNVKWLKELSQIGSKDHRDLVSLMETLTQVRVSVAS